MLKEFQTDVLTHKITHIDLLKIDLKEKVMVKIPIHVVGKSVGVGKGGLIEQARREIEAKCLPGSIPEKIEVDITDLDIGHSIHLNELKLPEEVEVPHEVNYAIVAIVAPKEEEVAPPPAPEAVEGAAPAGGTAAAPAGGTPTAAGEKEAAKETKSEKK